MSRVWWRCWITFVYCSVLSIFLPFHCCFIKDCGNNVTVGSRRLLHTVAWQSITQPQIWICLTNTKTQTYAKPQSAQTGNGGILSHWGSQKWPSWCFKQCKEQERPSFCIALTVAIPLIMNCWVESESKVMSPECHGLNYTQTCSITWLMVLDNEITLYIL